MLPYGHATMSRASSGDSWRYRPTGHVAPIEAGFSPISDNGPGRSRNGAYQHGAD